MLSARKGSYGRLAPAPAPALALGLLLASSFSTARASSLPDMASLSYVYAPPGLHMQALNYPPPPALLYVNVNGTPTPVTSTATTGVLAYPPTPILAKCMNGTSVVDCAFGSGSGTVTTGSQYAVPYYTAAGTTLGPSNIVTDATGNNITVPGTGYCSPAPLNFGTTGTAGWGTAGATDSAFLCLASGIAGSVRYQYFLFSRSVGLVIGGNQPLAFASGAAGGAGDAGISRVNSSIVAVGNGSAGDFSGTLILAAARSGTASNTDLTGTLTINSGSTAPAAPYTFAKTYTTAPGCLVQPQGAAISVVAAMGVYVPTVTTTTLTINVQTAPTANVTFAYHCDGRN